MVQNGKAWDYVSSITLGAMTYTVETCKERNLNQSLGGGANIPFGGVIKVNVYAPHKTTRGVQR